MQSLQYTLQGVRYHWFVLCHCAAKKQTHSEEHFQVLTGRLFVFGVLESLDRTTDHFQHRVPKKSLSLLRKYLNIFKGIKSIFFGILQGNEGKQVARQ
jgi:hypothetical protein